MAISTESLEKNYVFVPSLSSAQVHHVDPYDLEHTLNRDRVEWGVVQTSRGVNDSTLWEIGTVADHI